MRAAMRDDRDYKVDLSTAGSQGPAGDASRERRPFLSVLFTCCNVYLRVYRSADGSGYRGQCPRCGRIVTFAVAPGGTDERFFRV